MENQSQKYHLALAEYFHSKDYFLESIEEQQARACSLPPTSRPVNIRKVVELPFHRLKAQQWDKIEELFSDLFFLESKTEGGLVFDLAADFEQVSASLPKTRTSHRYISLLGKALLREINFISRHPAMMFQCIWNLCWWEAEESTDYSFKQQLFSLIRTKRYDRLKVLAFSKGLHHLMEIWAAKKEFVQPGFYWIRSHHPPITPLGTSTGSIFVGHLAKVMVACYSPDGLRIASGSNDNSVRIWDTETGRELAVYIAKNPFIERIGFSADGLYLASRFDSGEVRLWDTRSGKELTVLAEHEYEKGWSRKSIYYSSFSDCSLATPNIRFSIDNQKIISRSCGGFEEEWEPKKGPKPISKKRSKDEISYLDISLDGRYGIRFLNNDKYSQEIILCDILGNVQLKTVDIINPIQIGLNQFVRFYNEKTGKKPLAKLKVISSLQYFLFIITEKFLNLFYSFPPLILGARFSPDGLRFACWSNDCIIRIWDTRKVAKLSEFRHHRRKVLEKNRIQKGANPLAFRVKSNREWPKISGAEFSPDGTLIVSWSDDYVLRVWNSRSGKEQAIFSGHSDKVNSVSWSPDGRSVISASSDRTIRVWQIEGGKLQSRKSAHKNSINGLAFSPDGQRLLSWSNDNTLRLWDTWSGRGTKELFGHRRGITDANWCLDNLHMVSGDYEGNVCVWNVEKSRPLALFGGDENLRFLESYEDIPCPVYYSNDGTRIISGSHASVMVWNVDAESLKRISYVAKNSDWTLMEREGRLFELTGHQDAVLSVCMSADKRLIASSSKDKTVRVWNSKEGTSLHVLRGHESAVNCVSFCPDGNRIASGSDDNTVRIWDSLSGNELCVLIGHSKAVHNLEWSRDGHFLVSSSILEQYIRLWDIDNKNCIKVFCGKGDLHALVTGDNLFPYRAWYLQNEANIETLIEDSATGKPVTWFSVPLLHLSEHPSGRTWAGADGKDIFLITLERGGISKSLKIRSFSESTDPKFKD